MFTLVNNILRKKSASLVTYCVAAVIFIFIYASIFPTIKSQANAYQQLINSLPTAVSQSLGITQLSITNLQSYFSTEYFSFLWKLLAILFALTYSSGAIAGEIENRTLGFLLAMPLSRANIYITKYIGGITQAIIFTFISIFGIIPAAAIFGGHNIFDNIPALSILCFLFILPILSLGFMFSSFFSKRSIVNIITATIVVGMYILDIVAALTTKLDKLKYFSFFYYFKASDVFIGKPIPTNAIIVFLAVSIVAFIIGLIVFMKRDIEV